MKKFWKEVKAFTLIEVLVAMLVLAIGLLGLAGITVVVLRSNVLSQQMTEATTLATNLMESLRQAPRDLLVDCQSAVAQATASNNTSCPVLAQSGVAGALAANNIYLPPLASDTSGCVIRGLLDGAANSTVGNQITFDSANSSVSSRAVPSGGASICSTTIAAPGTPYLRYYRTIRDSATANVTEWRLVSVVLWKDRFGKWRSVRLDTRRTTTN